MINTKNNEIIEIDHKQVSPRYTIDIYLSSTYVAHLPTFSPIGYRLSRHTRTFTGKHLFFSSQQSSSIIPKLDLLSSPREFAKRRPSRSSNTIEGEGSRNYKLFRGEFRRGRKKKKRTKRWKSNVVPIFVPNYRSLFKREIKH